MNVDDFIKLLEGAELDSWSGDAGDARPESDWVSGRVEAYLQAAGLSVKFQLVADFPKGRPSKARIREDRHDGNRQLWIECDFEVEDDEGDILDEDDIIALVEEHTELFDTDWYDLTGFGDDEVDSLSGSSKDADWRLTPSTGVVVAFKGDRMFSARGQGFDSIETELSLYKVDLDEGDDEDIWVLFARDFYGKRLVLKFAGESAGSELDCALSLFTSERAEGFSLSDTLVEAFKGRSMSHLDCMPDDWEWLMSEDRWDQDEEDEEEDEEEELEEEEIDS